MKTKKEQNETFEKTMEEVAEYLKFVLSNALFKCGVIESYTFSRNERLQQSELRLMFKEVEDE